MENILIYQLKAAAVLTVLYLFYNVLLTRETFHRVNRIVLLFNPVLAFTLPLCVITVIKEIPRPAGNIYASELSTAPIAAISDSPDWKFIGAAIYIGVCIPMLVSVAVSYMKIWHFVSHQKHETTPNGSKLIIGKKEFSPFSWFNYIILSENDFEENPHELLHTNRHI